MSDTDAIKLTMHGEQKWAKVPFQMVKNHYAMAAWVCLYWHTNYGGSYARVTRAQIQKEIGVSKNTLTKALKWLVENNYLIVSRYREPANGVMITEYKLFLDGLCGQSKKVDSHNMTLPDSHNMTPLFPRNDLPSSIDKNNKEKPNLTDWAVKLANSIRVHVSDNFGLNTNDSTRNRWAKTIDALTRSRVLSPKPTSSEVERVVLWGLQDKTESGSWPGWSQNIRSAPEARKFANIRTAMTRSENNKPNYNENADLN